MTDERTIHRTDSKQWHSADLADRLERLQATAAAELLRSLPVETAAAALAEVDNPAAATLLDQFTAAEIVAWLRLLPPSAIADLAFALPPDLRAEVLNGLPADLRAESVALLRYTPDSAGGIMDNRFVALQSERTVGESLVALRSSGGKPADDVLYVYAIDNAGRLVGVVSLRELLFAPAERVIREIMNPNVRFLRVQDDQEQIARQIQHDRLLGLPVIDDDGRLVGVVKVRDAIRVAEVEATEDMQLMVGLSGEERIWTPWRHSIQKRLPWLGVNLVTALGAATVVSIFEETISKWTALVAFLPLICAVAGNAGNQALTVIIRSLALGEVAPGDGMRAFRKELFIGAANGLALAIAIGLIGYAWKGSWLLGVVAGSAMFLNQIIGALSGVIIPFGLRWCKVDPALASSILVTALTDTMGFLVFLGAATVAMQF